MITKIIKSLIRLKTLLIKMEIHCSNIKNINNNNNYIKENFELESYYGDDNEIDEQIKEKLLNKVMKATCKIILEKEKIIKGSGFFSIITINNKIKKNSFLHVIMYWIWKKLI